MLPFHCPIEPEEHLLSWLSRVHLLSGNTEYKYTSGVLNISNKPLKACNHNEAFRDCISVSNNCITHNTEAFDMHTPFSLWALSFSYNDFTHWRRNNEYLMPQCLEPSKLAFRTTWQYCPICSTEDIEGYGHSLWHVKHQLPSVTHCYKHRSKLVSDSKLLLDLRKMTLPEGYEFEAPSLNDEPLLLEWSTFVLKIYEQLKKNGQHGEILRSRVRQYLSVPDEIKAIKGNLVFASMQKQFDEEVPHELLRHLFLFYSHSYKHPQSVLKSTLGYSPRPKIKHPVYWLIILYWLKDKISLEMA